MVGLAAEEKISCRAAGSGWSEGENPDATCSAEAPGEPSAMGKHLGVTGFTNRSVCLGW